MDIERKTETGRIDPESEIDYHYIRGIEKAVQVPHMHEYFEIFLITKGMVIHEVNGTSQVLSKGFMALVRPDDVHCYRKHPQEDVHFINLAFPRKTLYEMFSYLGDSFLSDALLSPPVCPFVVIPEVQTNIIHEKIKVLEKLAGRDKPKAKVGLRMLLVELICNHFYYNYVTAESVIPSWMEELNRKLHEDRNFAEGMETMKALSGKSAAYLCRMYKKYYNLTPVEYLNRIRTHYAAGLLTATDKPVIDVAMEVGFMNLSHFYKVFKERYNISPGKYRTMGRTVKDEESSALPVPGPGPGL